MRAVELMRRLKATSEQARVLEALNEHQEKVESKDIRGSSGVPGANARRSPRCCLSIAREQPTNMRVHCVQSDIGRSCAVHTPKRD